MVKCQSPKKTFNDIWRKYKGTCFFHYVNEYHFKRRWHLNPEKPDFKASVDRLLADRSGLETFFRQSLRVMNDLVRILDRRALQGVALPQFPSRIEPAQTVTTRADSQITAHLKYYSVKAA
jgi:hypothetical protein